MSTEADHKIVCLEQRVDLIMREFIDELKDFKDELKGVKSSIVELSKQVDGLEKDKAKAQGFIAGAVFLATAIGGAAAFVFQHITGWKL